MNCRTMKPQQYIVVDDDKTNNLICEFLIKAFDPEAGVFTYNEPEDGLQHVKNSIKDELPEVQNVLFVDLNMPAMSGFEFVEELLEFRADLADHYKIFILTSSIEDFEEKKQEYPFVLGFLSKPLTKTHLREIAEGIYQRQI